MIGHCFCSGCFLDAGKVCPACRKESHPEQELTVTVRRCGRLISREIYTESCEEASRKRRRQQDSQSDEYRESGSDEIQERKTKRNRLEDLVQYT